MTDQIIGIRDWFNFHLFSSPQRWKNGTVWNLQPTNLTVGLPCWLRPYRICLQYKRLAHIQSLGWEDPLEEGMATHSSILAWRIPWTEEPGGLQSMASQRVRHDWATNTFTFQSYGWLHWQPVSIHRCFPKDSMLKRTQLENCLL